MYWVVVKTYNNFFIYLMKNILMSVVQNTNKLTPNKHFISFFHHEYFLNKGLHLRGRRKSESMLGPFHTLRIYHHHFHEIIQDK